MVRYRVEDRPGIARRLASIISAQKRGRARPTYGRRSGHVDARNLYRISVGDGRVFKRAGAPSPTRLRLVVLLDMSGSMGSSPMGRMATAAQIGWDLVLAAKQAPSVTIEVWGHTTSDLAIGEKRLPGSKRGVEGDYIKVIELYQKGDSLKSYLDVLDSHALRGNDDAFAIKTLGEDVLKRRNGDERVLIVVVSDGAPVMAEANSLGAVQKVVNDLRQQGVAVVGVSVDASLRLKQQEVMYGHDFVVGYDENTNLTLQSIARAVGKALN